MKLLDKVLARPLHVAEVRPSENSKPENARSVSHLQGVDLRTVFIALDPHGKGGGECQKAGKPD